MGGCVKDLQAMRGLFPEFDEDIDCPRWLAEEQEYLSSLQHEPKSEALKIEYNIWNLLSIFHSILYSLYTKLRLRSLVRAVLWSITHNLMHLTSPKLVQELLCATQAVKSAQVIVKALEANGSLELPWTIDSSQWHKAILLQQE